MRRETYTDSKLVESREAVGAEWIIRDGQGVETGREPLTEAEVAQFAEEEKPSPDAQLIADLQGTPTVAQLTAALRKRFGG